ncbi:tetratricopeptide repeat protein [Anaeramoeba flamelloides]|uniref:Tetratricopeptide repeat protein n=1 Tax=Anaeramoeba flamelloides TaxID=1746091 RepID=A0AAV8A6A1_9EUKA|nr:tetratricopeptide repeat protein [Anaeramoeba flamelloides]
MSIKRIFLLTLVVVILLEPIFCSRELYHHGLVRGKLGNLIKNTQQIRSSTIYHRPEETVKKEDKLYQLYQRANYFYQQGNYNLSLNLYQKIKDSGQNTVALHFKIGNTFFLLSDYHKAIDSYSLAIQLDNKNTESLFWIAYSYYVLEDFDQATTWFNNLVSVDDQSTEGYYWLGVINFNLCRYQNAQKHFDKALLIDPDNVDVNYWKAIVFYFLNDYSSSKHFFQNVLEVDPHNFDATSSLNSIYKENINTLITSLIGIGFFYLFRKQILMFFIVESSKEGFYIFFPFSTFFNGYSLQSNQQINQASKRITLQFMFSPVLWGLYKYLNKFSFHNSQKTEIFIPALIWIAIFLALNGYFTKNLKKNYTKAKLNKCWGAFTKNTNASYFKMFLFLQFVSLIVCVQNMINMWFNLFNFAFHFSELKNDIKIFYTILDLFFIFIILYLLINTFKSYKNKNLVKNKRNV